MGNADWRLQTDSRSRRSEAQLLRRLAEVRTIREARTVVRELERKLGFDWRPVGDRENNYGIINIGSDPGLALVERVTNALDAVVEQAGAERVRAGLRFLPSTPREAVKEWFGVPAGRLKNLDPEAREEAAKAVVVRLFDGGARQRPSVEVRDFGIGLAPDQIPSTILGLGEGNKIDKPFLAGAYGQGGSTALAFSPEGALFVTRRQPRLLEANQPDLVAVTFAQFRDLDPRRNKNGRYEYLVRRDGSVAAIPISFYPEFEAGTSVIHFDLRIPQYSGKLTSPKGSLTWLLENALFDPVLPLRAEELRRRHAPATSERITVAGNHSRLSVDSRGKVEHADSVEIFLDHPGSRSAVRVHYWVVRESEDGKSKRPIDVYVDPYRPVAYTYFGQTHGTDDQRFTSDRLGLPYLAKFLILQVELDGLAPVARRELLSSTRDRLKQSALTEEMRGLIATALSNDPELVRLNHERKESILSRHSEAERERMRQRFAKLMDRFKAGTDAFAGGKGDRPKGREALEGGEAGVLEALPTSEHPTFLRIANRRLPIPLRKNRSSLLHLVSDAPDGYLMANPEAKLLLDSDPEDEVRTASLSDFRGGRCRVVIRPAPDAAFNRRGTLTAYLITPRPDVFSCGAEYEVLEPKEEATSGDKGRAQVQVPAPIPVPREEWSAFGWDEASVAAVREEPGETNIHVNMDNRHLRRLLDGGGYKEAGHTRMSNSYLLYVAFYAWLQHRAGVDGSPGLEGELFEKYLQEELDRAAQTVIYSISAEGRLEDS